MNEPSPRPPQLENHPHTVRWGLTGSTYAVQFHRRGFSLVPDDEATPFPSATAARAQIQRTREKCGQRGGTFTIMEAPRPKQLVARSDGSI